MSRTLQFRRYDSLNLANTIGANGELIINTSNHNLTVHDGLTAGGFALASANDVTYSTDSYARTTANGAVSLAQSAYNYANTIVSDTQIDQVARNTANGANGLAAGAFAAANTKLSSSGGTITGDLTVTGNTSVTKEVTANTVVVNATLYSGLASRSSVFLPDLIAQFASNSASYIQVNSQNINPQGSADYVVTADNGSDTDFYIDMGLHGSQAYDKLIAPYDGYLLVQGSTIGQSGGNLIIGTTSSYSGLQTMFVAGGYNSNNVVMKLNTAGANVVGNLTVTGTTYAKVPGPYASDAAAASAGVAIGQMYYRSTGITYVRLT